MISPWSYDAVLPSPDGQKTARTKDTQEIGMGAPTSGTLVVSTGITLESCNPSMVWSADSRFLAVPRWTPDRAAQQLVIVDVEQGTVRVLPRRYRVLQLDSFNAGVVRGGDSPVYHPHPVAVAVTEHVAP